MMNEEAVKVGRPNITRILAHVARQLQMLHADVGNAPAELTEDNAVLAGLRRRIAIAADYAVEEHEKRRGAA